MVTIRLLTAADIPQIIRLGGNMHYESNFASIGFEPQKVVDKVREVLACPQSYFGMVAEDEGAIIGIMGAVIGEYEFGYDRISNDILVYITPEYRGSRAFIKLVKAYVIWAKEMGAKLIFLNQSTGINIDLVADLYVRLGFKRVGGMFCYI